MWFIPLIAWGDSSGLFDLLDLFDLIDLSDLIDLVDLIRSEDIWTNKVLPMS